MIKFILVALLVESVTNIVSKSEIFLPIRRWLFYKNKFLHNLIDCPYCLSVWVGLLCSVLCDIKLTFSENLYVDYIISGLLLHRSSNILHYLIDLLMERN